MVDLIPSSDTLPPPCPNDPAAFATWARDRMSELAQAVVGDGMHHSGERADAFLVLIAAGERRDVANSLARASGCGLTVRGLWRRFGLVDPRLVAPYTNGSAMQTIHAMALEADAWISPAALRAAAGNPYCAPEDIASPGDVLFFEDPEHVATVTAALPSVADGAIGLYDTSEGGQKIAGDQAILARRRRLVDDGARVGAGDELGAFRPLLGVVDLVALARKFFPGAP